MLAFYVLVVLLTVLMIGAIVYVTRPRGEQRPADRPDLNARGPATLVRVDTQPPEMPAVPDDFDPEATLVYRGSSQPAGVATARKREHVTTIATPSGAHLVGLSGPHKGSHIAISADGITVGRSPYSDIVLADPRVSFRHAWVGIVDGKAVLRDLKSTNGTFLNAQLKARITEMPLSSGDTIFFGGHQGDQFRFVVD
jgi:hypothetical protein